MITVHNLKYTRAIRIAWLLEELGVEYDIKTYLRDPETYSVPPEFVAGHPLALSPYITDGDLTLGESGAIIEYILYKYGNGKLKPPVGSPEWIQYLFWFEFSEGSFMSVLFVQRVLNKFYEMSPEPDKSVLKAVKDKIHGILLGPRLDAPLDFAEAALSKTKWFAGNEFSAADIQMAIPIFYAHNMQELTKPRPKIEDFMKRVQERRAFESAAKKAGPIDKGWVD